MTDQPVVIERDNGSGAVVAVVTLIALALIGYFAYQYFGGQTDATPSDSTNINLEVPTPTPTPIPSGSEEVAPTEAQ